VRSFQREYGEREVTDLDRERARVLERLANSRMQHRSWKAARDIWVQALEMTPDEPMFHLRERFCRAVLKEYPYDETAVAISKMDLKVERELSVGERGKREVEKIYREGWLWKLAGEEAKALSCFRKIVALDPEHREAQREVRLHARRSKQSPAEGEKRRGFGSLLRRKKD
jgi:tetratricopeptide (TPR) repeat protein